MAINRIPEYVYRITDTITSKSFTIVGRQELMDFCRLHHLTHVTHYLREYKAIKRDNWIIEVDSNRYYKVQDKYFRYKEEAIEYLASLGYKNLSHDFFKYGSLVNNPCPFDNPTTPVDYNDVLLEKERRTIYATIVDLPSDTQDYDYTASRKLYLRLFGVQFEEALAKSNL